MALSKEAGGGTTKSVYVNGTTAGSGGTVYTVPEGKVFKGYLIQNSTSALNPYINGTQLNVNVGSTSYGRNPVVPFTLPPGTVLQNASSNYFIITGELVDGS